MAEPCAVIQKWLSMLNVLLTFAPIMLAPALVDQAGVAARSVVFGLCGVFLLLVLAGTVLAARGVRPTPVVHLVIYIVAAVNVGFAVAQHTGEVVGTFAAFGTIAYYVAAGRLLRNARRPTSAAINNRRHGHPAKSRSPRRPQRNNSATTHT